MRKAIDPNQLVNEWQYDSLGRETLEKRPDGSQTTTTLSREKVGETWRHSQRIATSVVATPTMGHVLVGGGFQGTLTGLNGNLTSAGGYDAFIAETTN